MTTELYSVKDVAKVREQLVIEQKNLDAITGLEIEPKQHVLDHSHSSQRVRAVLSRQTNAALGKIEGIWTRYLSYWYPHDLPTFLRQVADYLERKEDNRWYHTGWLKRVTVDFSKLTATQKKNVLNEMNCHDGKNNTDRMSIFRKQILTKEYSFPIITDMINKQKGT